jgi:ketosteroid isomerase-like protein
MKALGLILFASAALAVPAFAAQTGGPNAEVTAVVDAALNAPLKGDMGRFRAQYAPDCVFADEFAPFLWTGPGAVDRWAMSGGRMYQETQHRDGKATFGPARYVYVSGDRAFVVEPVKGEATVRGRPYAQDGAFAFSLARIDGRWKITSQTWTKASETSNPY